MEQYIMLFSTGLISRMSKPAVIKKLQKQDKKWDNRPQNRVIKLSQRIYT